MTLHLKPEGSTSECLGS